MNGWNKWLIVVIAAVIAVNVLGNVLLMVIDKRLTAYMMAGSFDSYERLLASPAAHFVFNPYRRRLLRLQLAIRMGDDEKVQAALHDFEQIKSNQFEKETIYTNAFYYYIGSDDAANVKLYYDRLKSFDDFSNSAIDRLYDTMVMKGSRYLKDTLTQLKGCDDSQRPFLESLIARMYQNKGDAKMFQKYQHDSQSHLKGAMAGHDAARPSV